MAGELMVDGPKDQRAERSRSEGTEEKQRTEDGDQGAKVRDRSPVAGRSRLPSSSLPLTSDLRPLTSDFEGQKKDETGETPGSEAAAA